MLLAFNVFAVWERVSLDSSEHGVYVLGSVVSVIHEAPWDSISISLGFL